MLLEEQSLARKKAQDNQPNITKGAPAMLQGDFRPSKTWLIYKSYNLKYLSTVVAAATAAPEPQALTTRHQLLRYTAATSKTNDHCQRETWHDPAKI